MSPITNIPDGNASLLSTDATDTELHKYFRPTANEGKFGDPRTAFRNALKTHNNKADDIFFLPFWRSLTSNKLFSRMIIIAGSAGCSCRLTSS
jgi:hypothetical protein